MSKPLDAMIFVVSRRPGEWDGTWQHLAPLLTAPVDGDPTPADKAAVDAPDAFTVGEWAQFYDAAGAILAVEQITSIVGPSIKFATGSLAFDAEIGDRVMPVLLIEASRPQPVGPEAIDMLDEGARSLARFIIYADDDQPELYLVGRNRAGYAADTIAYNGENHLLASDADWHDMPLGHRAYIMLEYSPDEKVPT